MGIIAGGRVLLRPIYRRIADLGNTDVFAALTLLVVLGTSMMTQLAGLSLALGAFLVSFPPASDPGMRCLCDAAGSTMRRLPCMWLWSVKLPLGCR